MKTWLVAVYFHFRGGGGGIQAGQFQSLAEVDVKVAEWQKVLKEECTCGECPIIDRIEVVEIIYEIKTVYGQAQPGPSDVWKGIFK